jgi:hypothetical protein
MPVGRLKIKPDKCRLVRPRELAKFASWACCLATARSEPALAALGVLPRVRPFWHNCPAGEVPKESAYRVLDSVLLHDLRHVYHDHLLLFVDPEASVGGSPPSDITRTRDL